MPDIFISYARSTVARAQMVAEALRALGYAVWRDDELPAHKPYAEVIEERLAAAKAVVVIWSAEATKSEWVQSEADRARNDRKLVQLRIDGAALPMPFDRIQCADLTHWTGEPEAHDWKKVVASVADLIGGAAPATASVASAPLALPSKPSIAVLPFANLSGDPEQDYFADGMVEEIITALSRFKSIFVIGSGSTLSFKGKAVSPQEAAASLGVRYVLEGSVRKSGPRVRIAVKLTDAADGAQIWGDRFEDTLNDIFALQDKVALTVAGVIEPAVETAEIRRAAKRPTDNMGGYDLYLRALPLAQAFEGAQVLQALDLLDRAVALDPHFGPAMAAAAQCRMFVVAFGWSEHPEDHRRLGLELARRAVTVGADDAHTLALAANAISGLGRDMDNATALVDRAMILNPGSSRVWQQAGILLLIRGETELAIERIETAMRLDPLSPRRVVNRLFVGIALFHQRRFSEALAPLREAVEQVRSPLAIAYLAANHGQLGQAREARAALDLYWQRASMPIEGMSLVRREDQQNLFLEGLALAAGERPAGAP